MLFFLLPLILNPFGIVIRWLPALYLAAWPIIVQTLGQEALLLHAVILIMFILCCDLTRELMLKLIGFDLISLPAGVALLAMLLTDKGTTMLSYIIPICSGLLVVVEPIFLLIETLIVMDMLKAVNRWISKASNIRDEDSSDISSWEPPLTRGSILMRFVVILITIASYLGAYMLVQESKALLGLDEKVQFNQAIALLVTLQLIAFTATIYKEEGILSESAMVVLVATVPIFIASWSYYNLKTNLDTSLGWSSYFPFSLFAASGSEIKSSAGAAQPSVDSAARAQRIVFGALHDEHDFSSTFGGGGGALSAHGNQLDYGALERAIHLIVPAENFLKHALLLVVKQLIMLINSILGLSWDKLAKYYFGPDFWYVLGARLICLIWWLVASKNGTSDRQRVATGSVRAQLRKVNARLPLSKTTLIKCLVVLAYAQMLIQQMENKHNLADQTNLLSSLGGGGGADGKSHAAGACCSSVSAAAGAASENAADDSGLLHGTASWLTCMWHSTRACSIGADSTPSGSRASRFFGALSNAAGQVLTMLLALLAYVYNRLISAPLGLAYAYSLWLVRWRSPIIQRLMQSILIQVYYICSVLFGTDRGDDDDEDSDQLDYL